MDYAIAERWGDNMMVPTVHLNGTSRESLIRGLEKAYVAITQAIDAVCDAAPHGRDYYVQDLGDAYNRARDEHESRVRKLVEVRNEIEELVTGIAEQ